MTGHWKNFDELETNLSLPELLALLESSRKQIEDERRFLAAIQGVDLDEDKSSSEEEHRDIVGLHGFQAFNEGFGINAGIGVLELGE